MSYQVLARKWRPKSFEQLVGQQQTATALSNALETQRLHHAYLFTGTRGVGKTTIARILSKSLNCEQGISSTPCGECSSCIEIDQGNFVDLMEIDAASKTKVEDTRELLDNVQYRPTRGRYKVYLIDEVHMLSGHSFNALLKTLEEPPPHVIFLLATTDPQKLPVTVLSRCLQFHLRRMEEQQIVDHLSKILTAESIQFEESALNPIAKGADGSMRDALSLMDQAIAYSGELISQKAVLEMLGTIDQNFCIRLLACIQTNDANAVMALIKEMAQFSPDFIEVMSDWLNLLHRLAVIQATNDQSDPELSELASQVSPADLQLYYQLSLQAKKDMAYAPHPRQGFEMALLRVLAFRPRTTENLNIQEQAAAKKKLNNLPGPSLTAKTDLDSYNRVNHQLEPIESVDSRTLTTASLAQNSRKSAQQTQTLQHSDQPQQAPQINQVVEPTDVRARLSLVSDNSNLTNQSNRDNEEYEEQGANCLSESQLVHDSGLANQTIEESRVSNHHCNDLATKSENVPSSEMITQSSRLNDEHSVASETEEQVKTDTNSKEKLAYHERPLYPNEAKVELEQISNDNWHVVIDQMKFRGNGQQVLINSLAEFKHEKLHINYLNKVEHFLTENLSYSLTKKIRKYFNQAQLQIVFEALESIERSPKDRQVELHKQALEEAYQNLISNSCVAKLQQTIGAKVDKSTLMLK